MVIESIDCPACGVPIAAEYGRWLWDVKNCPRCLAPLMPVEDDYTDGTTAFFFITDAEWR